MAGDQQEREEGALGSWQQLGLVAEPESWSQGRAEEGQEWSEGEYECSANA